MKILRFWSVLLAVLSALVVFSPPAVATTPVHLSGTVTNTDGVGQNGYVYVKRVGDNSASGVGLADGSWSWDWNVDTKPEGDYLIYVRSTTMDNVERWYAAGDPAGTTQESLATPVHLGAGSPDLHITMVMPAIAKVSGRLVDASNAGVAGLSVSLNEDGAIRSTTTGPGGLFDLGCIRAGSWKLFATGPDHLTAQAGVTVPGSGTVVMPDLLVHRAAAIEGRVTDSGTGNPVPFVQVTAYSAASHTQIGMPVQTDASGHYQLARLDSTPFVLAFADPYESKGGYSRVLNDGGDPVDWSPQSPITLGEGEQRVYDQELVLKAAPTPPAHTMSGTVTDIGGAPLAGISVTAGDLEATTDRRGHWFLDAPDGTHDLSFAQDPVWSQILGSQLGWFPATLSNASGSSYSTQLRRAGRITGRLTVSGGPELDEHEVWAYAASGALLAHDELDSGEIFSVDVPSGLPIHLLARGRVDGDPVTEFLPRWFGDVDSLAVSTPIQVDPGETVAGKDVHLVAGLTNLIAPAVTGVRSAGRTLTVSTGTWSTMTMTRFTTTWWRGTVQVGSGASYVVKPADAGHAVRARVVASNGTLSATSFTAPVTIAKLIATAALRGTSPGAGKARLMINVSAPGLTPAGTVVIKRGAKVVKRVVLTGGKATVLLRRQPKGVQRYQVSYAGSAQVSADSSPVVRVRVR